MPLFTDDDRPFAHALSDLVYANPFLPERIEHERRALGVGFEEAQAVWSFLAHTGEDRPNVQRMRERVVALTDGARAALVAGERATGEELRLYEDLVLYRLYEHHRLGLHEAIEAALAGRKTPAPQAGWRRFRAEFGHYLELGGVGLPTGHRPEHVFACYFQIRRAFSHIYHYIVGASMPAAGLRAAVWQSIFTHDFRRYYTALYPHMGDYATLITGQSGTGKELVAQAIGRCRYIPFDAERGRFAEDFAASFYAVNLSALSPTLIESELFGHARGSFTGATADRAGWLEQCPPLGAVFLDEIGELDGAIQVKLLRVLQTRTFQRLGDTATRTFRGKIISATNRDLPAEMARGTFRPDFYYRLCSDTIRTPSLREQLDDRPADLERLAAFIARRLIPTDEDAAAALVEEACGWIAAHLGDGYPWPGNFRELEQCLRGLVVRRVYHPPAAGVAGDALAGLFQRFRGAALSADELLDAYAAHVYGKTGSYVAAAERLGLDRRTVKARVERAGKEPRMNADERG